MQALVFLGSAGLRYIEPDLLPKEIKIYCIIDILEKALVPCTLIPLFQSLQIIEGGVADSALVQLNEAACQQALEALIAAQPSWHWQILTFSEENLILTARIAHRLGLGGLTEAQLLPYRNKVLMKQCLQDKGLRVPHHHQIDLVRLKQSPEAYFSTLRTTLRLPFILKPVENCGSYGVCRVDSLQHFLNWEQSFSYDCVYEAEEFIKGTLYHCDTAISKGKIIFSECARYTCPNLDFLSYHPLGSAILMEEGDPLRAKILDFAHQSIAAMGWIDTVSHMELFVNDREEVVFLEIGARPPGASIATMYRHDFGLNFMHLYLNIMLGVPYHYTTHRVGYSLWAILPIKAGVVEECIWPDLQGNCQIEWKVKPGDRLENPRSICDISGRLFSTCLNTRQLQMDFDTLKNYRPLKLK